MTIDEQIARAKELFAGMAPVKKITRCKVCGEPGHMAKTCLSKIAEVGNAAE